MGRTPSPDAEATPRRAPDPLPDGARAALLEVAHDSVDHGLRAQAPLEPDPSDFAPPLRQVRASFVTLRVEGRLRGCTGALDACRPLVVDVARNAFLAAFRDPRFPPLRSEERAGLALHLSILSPHEPLAFRCEAELLAQLRPHVHGLVIEAEGRRATFLPAVWEQLSDPRAFLRELKVKAGLTPDHAAERLRAARYTVESIA